MSSLADDLNAVRAQVDSCAAAMTGAPDDASLRLAWAQTVVGLFHETLKSLPLSHALALVDTLEAEAQKHRPKFEEHELSSQDLAPNDFALQELWASCMVEMIEAYVHAGNVRQANVLMARTIPQLHALALQDPVLLGAWSPHVGKFLSLVGACGEIPQVNEAEILLDCMRDAAAADRQDKVLRERDVRAMVDMIEGFCRQEQQNDQWYILGRKHILVDTLEVIAADYPDESVLYDLWERAMGHLINGYGIVHGEDQLFDLLVHFSDQSNSTPTDASLRKLWVQCFDRNKLLRYAFDQLMSDLKDFPEDADLLCNCWARAANRAVERFCEKGDLESAQSLVDEFARVVDKNKDDWMLRDGWAAVTSHLAWAFGQAEKAQDKDLLGESFGRRIRRRLRRPTRPVAPHVSTRPEMPDLKVILLPNQRPLLPKLASADGAKKEIREKFKKRSNRKDLEARHALLRDALESVKSKCPRNPIKRGQWARHVVCVLRIAWCHGDDKITAMAHRRLNALKAATEAYPLDETMREYWIEAVGAVFDVYMTAAHAPQTTSDIELNRFPYWDIDRGWGKKYVGENLGRAQEVLDLLEGTVTAYPEDQNAREMWLSLMGRMIGAYGASDVLSVGRDLERARMLLSVFEREATSAPQFNTRRSQWAWWARNVIYAHGTEDKLPEVMQMMGALERAIDTYSDEPDLRKRWAEAAHIIVKGCCDAGKMDTAQRLMDRFSHMMASYPRDRRMVTELWSRAMAYLIRGYARAGQLTLAREQLELFWEEVKDAVLEESDLRFRWNAAAIYLVEGYWLTNNISGAHAFLNGFEPIARENTDHVGADLVWSMTAQYIIDGNVKAGERDKAVEVLHRLDEMAKHYAKVSRKTSDAESSCYRFSHKEAWQFLHEGTELKLRTLDIR